MNTEMIWNELIEMSIANEEELILVTTLNGYNVETLNDVLFVRTGYRSLEQLTE